jgi:hypothetical protein
MVLASRAGRRIKGAIIAQGGHGKVEGIVILVSAILLLDVAARWWGVDSREGVESHEWERRQAWGKW